jgi:hypothetical protein
MSILAFANGVFPQIPFAKGGGNYERVPDVEIYWKKESCQVLPPNVNNFKLIHQRQDMPVKSARLKIIEETPTVVFVANPADPPRVGVRGWSFWQTPAVIGLKRDDITAIIHLSTDSGPACSSCHL